MKGIQKKKIFVLTFILSGLLLIATAQFPPWNVPAEVNDLENPTTADKKSLEAGKSFYELNCQACHGQGGLGDGVIPSGNMTTKAFSDQTDGALFWKLQQGRGQMPSFRAAADTDLWNVINYIRTFAEPLEDVVRKDASIVLIFSESDSAKYVSAQVYEILENGEQTPAREIKVNFYIKRYFADMLIGGNRNYTTEDGTVSISFPEGIPGEEGKLAVIARVEDSEFNPAEIAQEVAWGIEKETYWNEDRQLWKNNDYVPVWLMISFFGVTAGILLAIAYVLMLVMKIRKAGSN
ncbi:MAG: cytochrome c [Bacteroidales bacterium]|nr:cytochrome c [Bacteroidales bacterium]